MFLPVMADTSDWPHERTSPSLQVSSDLEWPREQISPSLQVSGDLLDWPGEHAKRTWDAWTFEYDDVSDEQREELDRFGARCREGMERARSSTRAIWLPDNYVVSSDTEDEPRTPTGLLTPDPEPRVALPCHSNPVNLSASGLNQAPAPHPVPSAAENAAKREASIEAALDEAALGPVERRPVVDFHKKNKRYKVSGGLYNDLWGTRHNTRLEERRRPHLFALNDAG